MRASPNKWGFQMNLSPEKAGRALIREIKEELNTDIKGRQFDRAPPGTLTRCFVCELQGDKPQFSTDHSEMRWVPENELRVDWAEPDLPAL